MTTEHLLLKLLENLITDHRGDYFWRWREDVSLREVDPDLDKELTQFLTDNGIKLQ